MDIKTLYLSCSLLAVFLAAGMSCLAVARPKYPYIRDWALSNAFMALGQIAVAYRGTGIPEQLSVAVTVPFYFLSAYTALRGLLVLCGERRRLRPATLLTIALLAGFWLMVLGGAQIAPRTLIYTIGTAILLGWATLYAWGTGRPPALRWPLRVSGFALGISVVLLLVRMVATVIWPNMQQIRTNSLAEGGFLLVFGLSYVTANAADIWLIITDETERHMAEQRRLFAEVEAAHAALEVQAADLRMAKVAAEAASAAKSTFLATMSHEIRTPLNSVIGFADLLLRSPLNEEQRRFVELQRDAGTGLLAVINDILDFSRLEAGKLIIEPADVEFASILQSCAALFRPAAKDKGLVLALDLAPTLPVRGRLDGYRLRQIVTNLLSNAIKFTRAGTVTLQAEGLSGERLRIEVRDTGIGIPADKQGRLFQQFSQLDGSISREFGGSGLGLAISRRLASLMGGTLGVSSELGLGSVFWLEVPYQPALLPRVQAPPPAEAEPRVRRRILVAEDVLPNQIMIETMLSKAGQDVTVVENGALALDAARTGDYDLILMDLQMPVMDGIEAARAIRALPGKPGEVPIFALTANVMAEEVAACREAGMQGHLAKPIDYTKLLATIEKVGTVLAGS